MRKHLARPYARVIVPYGAWYAARMLEFPGCFAEGRTVAAAYENLEVAAVDWIEAALEQGMTLPEPEAEKPRA